MPQGPEALAAQYAQQLPTLLPEQLAAAQRAVSSALAGEGACVFLDAPGGTGKTYCLNAMLRGVRGAGEVAIAVAYSGIAATLLEGGRTFRSRFKVPLAGGAEASCRISAGSGLARLLQAAKLIVFDEAPMAHRHNLEAAERALRTLCPGDGRPFAGKTVVLAGDFRQVLPVVKLGSQAQVLGASIKKSALWAGFEVARLETNVRARAAADPEEGERRARWLLQLGDGALPELDGRVALPAGSTIPATVDAAVARAFPKISEPGGLEGDGAKSAVLAPCNAEVAELNAFACDAFAGEATACFSADELRGEGSALSAPAEHLNSIDVSELPPRELRLKPRMPVMLLRNADPGAGLCNGTRLRVLAVRGGKLLEAQILSGSGEGAIAYLPRARLLPSDGEFPFEWSRTQFPVRPAFAMTIHKAQGQTLARAAVFLRSDVFSHGQLYVAASRVGDPANLRFAAPGGCGTALNVVYPGALA